ncbi:hypothetical protein [Flavobacterium coralii]
MNSNRDNDRVSDEKSNNTNGLSKNRLPKNLTGASKMNFVTGN